jgi:uncharacterized protein
MIAVVDSGPLYAVSDADDDDHRRCRELLERGDLQLVVPALVVAEVTYMIGRRLGPKAESRFLAGLQGIDVEAPADDDWKRIGELVRRYASFPLGGTDASVVVLAERLDTDVVVTLDRGHFGAVKPRHRASFRLLPE